MTAVMTPVTVFDGKRVALFGLGGSGLVSADALRAGGAEVAVWDDKEPAREKAAAAGHEVLDLSRADWSQFRALILAPGVPLTHPKSHWTVEKARVAGIEIIGDIELFCRERRHIAPKSPFIAITGTNGKSTTTALIAHLFRFFGHEVAVGGNIGTPILALPPPSPERVHVIECSSFQIDLAPTLDPSVGILLNITPDHLDRHGTMENYAEIKERLVQGADHAVIGLDDVPCVAIAGRLRARGKPLTCISNTFMELLDGITLDGTRLVRHDHGVALTIADLAGIASLRGRHNGQNAAAAVAALEGEGRDLDRVRRGLASFPGLAHRLEEVGRLGKTLFVNDSKATNADAAEKALLSFDNIYWILGGKAKAGGIEPLKPLFGKIAKGYLIGEATEAFAATIEEAFPIERCGTLDVAVAAAARDAAKSTADPVVLLSPACASYDQFPDFEKRGDYFRTLARAIIDGTTGN